MPDSVRRSPNAWWKVLNMSFEWESHGPSERRERRAVDQQEPFGECHHTPMHGVRSLTAGLFISRNAPHI
ncbi:hypothetical protein SCP_0115310 [Sparassis crispa]|uniref:Uncharacterized protein n=1 Tax=Sparassis crispa TaxID=139825 RepID=A0A401G905_9APHY|nr:hypothetical protein SCP_0115310 [Sparassis crispa]GBE78642.1 hypothetical protein SCP_0115310 [Sparassis crispa]